MQAPGSGLRTGDMAKKKKQEFSFLLSLGYEAMNSIPSLSIHRNPIASHAKRKEGLSPDPYVVWLIAQNKPKYLHFKCSSLSDS